VPGREPAIVGAPGATTAKSCTVVAERRRRSAILPVVAPDGTVTVSEVAVAELTTAITAPNVTALPAGVAAKPVPVIAT
jgi:hypothetical protein